ncbi:DNA cytosine methyltransferase [Kroppenstedtia guangzhouensis]|uniref:DNA cytosine methyltransferase n=1 Tax=Kroppenstedtia guangzhouensis TaxID=1274356 RepID=UPI00166B0263|nr:DNA cytosine methyltransferase [Kroppenstedtia guangzhouensis]
MRALDLFSGIGGIALAAHWAGIETAAFCEIEPYCQQVLSRHWPGVPIYTDVHGITRECLEEDGVMDDDRTIDIVLGGYPCQPFSSAGKRKGETDDRHLWPEMFRIIQETRPNWVVGENVAGHITLGIDSVLADLEGEGYTCRAFLLPAASVGAPHKRERVFIVAHSSLSRRNNGGNRREERQIHSDQKRDDPAACADGEQLQFEFGADGQTPTLAHTASGQRRTGAEEPGAFRAGDENRRKSDHPHGSGTACMAYPFHSRVEGGTKTGNPEGERPGSHQHPQRCNQFQRGNGGATQSRLGRASDGVPAWMDQYRWPAAFGESQREWEAPRLTQGGKHRRERLQALGNAVVPQQIYPILKAISDYEEATK